jgi:macrodomain Ter protein organizer (MatP/YcbG family)
MKRQDKIFAELRRIRTMEVGKLCLMRRTASGREYYNLQSWTNGRNITRYVPASQLDAVRQALANHERFMALVQKYVSMVVVKTRHTADKGKNMVKR